MRVNCIKVYTDKQYTRSIWCLQLTHSETSTHTVRLCLVQQQHESACESSCHTVSNFSTCWEQGGRRRPLCYPSPSSRNPLLWAGVFKLSTCYLHTGTRRLRGGSVCVLMSSIRISQGVVFARYRRRSLSYDILAMCGCRLISRYRLIDIIPNSVMLPQCTCSLRCRQG